MDLRPVRAMVFRDNFFGPVPTDRPEMLLIDPRFLLIDDRYQRRPSRRTVAIVEKMVRHWSWRKFKPPIVTFYGDSDGYKFYVVIDGQHTSIGAVTLGIPLIPVLCLVGEVELDSQADAFVSHNRDRVRVSDSQVFLAEVTAKNPEALAIQAVLKDYGAQVVESIKSRYQEGDTSSVQTLRHLYRTRGPVRFSQIVQTCVEARLAPIGQADLRAVDSLLNKGLQPYHLATAIRHIIASGEAKLYQYAPWSEKIESVYNELQKGIAA